MQDPSRKVLVVDGDSTRAAATAAALRARTWEPVVTRDAMLAFSVALKMRPSLIVLRDQLAGGGAPAFLARLRNSAHTAGAHVIVVGREGARTLQDLLTAGAQACLAGDATPEAVAAAAEAARAAGTAPLREAPACVIASPARAQAVAHYAGLRAASDSPLQELTALAATLLGTRASMLTLVSADRQTFLTESGLPADTGGGPRSTPLSHSFCQWVVSSRAPVLVDDARAHPVLRHNGAIESLGVVAYAGVPVSAGEDHTLGSFCTADPQPRAWEAEDLLVLKSLGKMVEAELVAAVPRTARQHRTFVVIGHGVSAAGSLLRRVQQRGIAGAEDVILRYLERQSRELMVQALGFGSAAAAQH
jgi:DNA-binding response OmpR family regulator